MPKDLLALIKFANEYKKAKTNVPFEEFLAQASKPTPQYTQSAGSYKVTSTNGTVTAIDLRTTDLAQVDKHEGTISIVWPHTTIDFQTEPSGDAAHLSQKEFDALAAFILD